MEELYKNNIAIWFDQDKEEINCPTTAENESNNTDTELHINFWKLEQDDFLDIGLKINIEIKDVYVYLPIEKNNFQLKDLGHILHKNQEVRYAVFNEVIDMSSCPLPLTNRNFINKKTEIYKTDKCGFCLVDIDEFDITPIEFGSIIHITLPYYKDKCPKFHSSFKIENYIRFRITGKFIKDLISKEELSLGHTSYYTSEISVIDLRINNVRSLPSSIVSKMYRHLPLFKKVQCFFMTESTYEVISTMKQVDNVRLLEKNVWKQYVTDDSSLKEKKEIIAYQWKSNEKQKLTDFILFLKVSHPQKFFIKGLVAFLCLSAVLGVINYFISMVLNRFFL